MAPILLTPHRIRGYNNCGLPFLFVAPADGEHRRLLLLVLPWLYLSGALIFSYLAYLNPQQYGELEWVRQLEWLPGVRFAVRGWGYCVSGAVDATMSRLIHPAQSSMVIQRWRNKLQMSRLADIAMPVCPSQ